MWGYADDKARAEAEGAGGEGGGPGAVAGLVLWAAVVAVAGKPGLRVLVDFGEVEGEVGGDVGVVLVDAGVEDGDADAGAAGGVPWAGVWGGGGACGDVVSEAAGLLDGPALRGGVLGIGGSCKVDDWVGGGMEDGGWKECAWGGDDYVGFRD